MQFTSVYVPLDGSERSQRALRPAVEIADRCDAEVVLLATPWPGEGLDAVRRALDTHVAFVEYPKVRPLLVQDRDPADAICMVATEPGALVCMSTRGRGAARETLLGSVGQAALRAATRPLLFVGPSFDREWCLEPRPVVVAGIDGSERAVGALEHAGEFATAVGGRVRAVEVVRPADVPLPDRSEWAVSADLDHLVAALRERGIRVDSALVDGFHPADTLIEEARLRRAACISVASHGRTGLVRAVMGSVALATVRRAPCPVLVSGPAVHRHAADGGQ